MSCATTALVGGRQGARAGEAGCDVATHMPNPRTSLNPLYLPFNTPHPLQPCSGLNCGRWDYMFSFIKTLRK
jgi:hypothetical protein